MNEMPGPPNSRRAFLVGAGAAALAFGTAGCSGAATSATSGEDPAKVTVPKAEIPVGGGKVVGDFVIAQPSAGTFTAFNKRCTHQGCPVTDVTATAIVCKCHGSYFDPKDGAVQKGPAGSPLQRAKVTDDGTTLTITP